MAYPSDPRQRLLTAVEAAQLLGVTPNCVHQWVHRGHLRPLARLNRSRTLLFREDHVLLAERARRTRHAETAVTAPGFLTPGLHIGRLPSDRRPQRFTQRSGTVTATCKSVRRTVSSAGNVSLNRLRVRVHPRFVGRTVTLQLVGRQIHVHTDGLPSQRLTSPLPPEQWAKLRAARTPSRPTSHSTALPLGPTRMGPPR